MVQTVKKVCKVCILVSILTLFGKKDHDRILSKNEIEKEIEKNERFV